MSNSIFPTPVGLGWTIGRSPESNTIVQRAVSGFERRTALMSYPLWHFRLTYEFLRSDSVNVELQAMDDFFRSRQGKFDSFLFEDTYTPDNAVTAQQFGVGDGVTSAFQLTRVLQASGFVEPVMNVKGTPTIFVGGVQETQAQLTSPAAPTLSQVAGGTIAATTYYVKTTYVDANGQETLASAESSLAVSLNNLLQVASPAAQTGATGWNVYVSTSTGTETRQNGSTPIAIGTAWTEPTSGLVAGAAQPASNKTGYTLSNTGLVTFNGAPASAAALTWTGGYYFRCRFDLDQVDFENFMVNLWSAKKVDLVGSLGVKV